MSVSLAKRERTPDVLEVDEMQRLLEPGGSRKGNGIPGHGPWPSSRRVSWTQVEDVDFERLCVNVTRSVVDQQVGNTKAEVSRKPVPIDNFLVKDLLTWHEQTPYKAPSDWVFATDSQPCRSKSGQTASLAEHRNALSHPAQSPKAGNQQEVSWHTFRHTFSTSARGNGEDVKVVQELLRHASAKMTLDTYSQALTPAKRAAQSKVVSMIRPKTHLYRHVPRVLEGISRNSLEKIWRPRRDLNPCYRRERAMS